MMWCGHFYAGTICYQCSEEGARASVEASQRRAAREADRAFAESIRWRVDPWGGEAMCIPSAFYGWEERDGIRHWVTTTVWVADRLGQRCAEVDALRCIAGEDG